MTEELKPCPFCGNTDVELQESHVGFSIECHNCDFHVGGDLTEKSVTKLWNQRTSTIGTLKLELSILDSEPMSELVEIICDHRDDMPPEMREKFVAWVEKHTTDEE